MRIPSLPFQRARQRPVAQRRPFPLRISPIGHFTTEGAAVVPPALHDAGAPWWLPCYYGSVRERRAFLPAPGGTLPGHAILTGQGIRPVRVLTIPHDATMHAALIAPS